MSKKKQASGPGAPKLSQSQLRSPDTTPPDELAAQRAEIAAEAARRGRQQGIELLSEGARLLAQNRPGEAAGKLERAAQLLPNDPDVAINLGGAYVLQRRYNKAVAVLERASQLAPDNAMVWTNLAAAYLGSLALSGPQQQSLAIAAYQRALQVDPNTANVHYNLGLIYNDRKEWLQAQACFLQALEVDPNDRDARQWLTRLARAQETGEIPKSPPASVDDAQGQP